jgi:hypothetical protein
MFTDAIRLITTLPERTPTAFCLAPITAGLLLATSSGIRLLASDPFLDVRAPIHNPTPEFETARPDVSGAIEAQRASRNTGDPFNVIGVHELIPPTRSVLNQLCLLRQQCDVP